MWHSRRRLSVIGTAVAALLLALAISCTGFFVNQPNSISVTTGANGGGSNTFTVAQGSSVKLFATATYSSGNKDVTNSATWQSSTSCAPVTIGTVKGVGPVSSVTITATLAGTTGSATGSVTGSGAQTLTITPAGPFTLSTTPSVQFTATDSASNNVTNSATWTSSTTSVLTFSSTTPGLATLATTGSSTVTASVSSGSTCESGSLSVTVQ